MNATIHLLHFSLPGADAEYIVLVEGDHDPADYCRSGYKLLTATTVNPPRTGNTLPLEKVMVGE